MIEFLMVPGAPAPVAPFSHATAVDGWIFVTGQMPTDPNDDSAPLPDGIEVQTHRVIENLQRVLTGIGSELGQVVFARVYLTHFERDYADERRLSILFRSWPVAGSDLHWRHRAGAECTRRNRSAGAKGARCDPLKP